MAFADLLAVGDRSVRSLLGGPITYTPGTGEPVTVEGVFDAAFQLVDAGQPGISSTSPAAFFTLSDLPTDPEVDTAATVTANGVAYSPYLVKPDGLGGVLLLLHKV